MQTDKQKAAKIRNWCIFRLRSISQAVTTGQLGFTYAESRTMQDICDKALARLGAETEADRQERIRKELIGGTYGQT